MIRADKISSQVDNNSDTDDDVFESMLGDDVIPLIKVLIERDITKTNTGNG